VGLVGEGHGAASKKVPEHRIIIESDEIPVSPYFSPLRMQHQRILMQVFSRQILPLSGGRCNAHNQNWVFVIALSVCGELLIRARTTRGPPGDRIMVPLSEI